MIKRTLFFLLLCLWLFAPKNIWAQMAIDVKGYVDSTQILIGDQLRYQLTVEALQPVQIQEPTFENFSDQEIFEVLNTSPWDTIRKGTQVTYLKDVMVTAWDTGYHHIPAVTVPYLFKGKAQKGTTLPIPIEVMAVAVDTTQLAPIKPILKEPFLLIDALPILLTILVIGLFIVGLIVWSRRNKKPPVVYVQPPRPAFEVAYEQLGQLEQKELWQKGEIKTYHSELNHILRAYLGGQFRIKALEASSTEINQDLQALDVLAPAQLDSIKTMLGKVDMIKFAKAEPPTEFHAGAMQEIREFVDMTKEKAISPPEEEDQGPELIPEDEVLTAAVHNGLEQNMSTEAFSQLAPVLAQLPAYKGEVTTLSLYRWGLWIGGIKREKLKVAYPASIVAWHQDNQSDFWRLINRVGNIFVFIPILGGILLLLLFAIFAVLSPVFVIMDLSQGKKVLDRGKIKLMPRKKVSIDYTIVSNQPIITPK